MTKLLIPLILAVASATSAPAFAQEQQSETCTGAPVTPPGEQAGWPQAQPLKAVTAPESSDAALLTPGKAVDLALASTPDVKFAIRPEHPGGSVSHSGIAAIRIDKSGTYRVAIDSGAWLDVIANGKSLESVGHGRGPSCTGIKKMVDFKLDAGRYVLQVAGNGAPNIRVMVTPVPGA